MGVATDLALALDPVLLARKTGIEPDPWQAALLRSTARQIILNCSRQSGKSTTTATLALHTAIYEPGAPVLLLSPSLRQSAELYRKVREAYRLLDDPGCKPVGESALRLELTNGSRILCLPGEEATVRGFSGVRLLIVDEASRVKDELYQAIRPMLAVSGGRIVLLSTPFGKRGFFFREWTEGKDWERVMITAEDCPRIPRAWLEQERRNIGDWWFRQEYLCEFMDQIDQLFTYEMVMGTITPEAKPVFDKEVPGWDTL